MSHEGARQRPHPRTIPKSAQCERRHVSRFPTCTKARRAALDRRALVGRGRGHTHGDSGARVASPPCACGGNPLRLPAWLRSLRPETPRSPTEGSGRSRLKIRSGVEEWGQRSPRPSAALCSCQLTRVRSTSDRKLHSNIFGTVKACSKRSFRCYFPNAFKSCSAHTHRPWPHPSGICSIDGSACHDRQ